MKQLLVLAIALTSVNAFATRARMTALGNAAHIVDTQTIYSRPTDIFAIGSDFATLESGITGTVATPAAANRNAEGMIVRTMGDAKMGLSLGHQSALNRGLLGAPTTGQQNPIEFTYGAKNGDMNWAGTLVYSNYNNKLAAAATIAKESTNGLRFAVAQGPWDVTLNLGLSNTVQDGAGNKFTGSSEMSVTGNYMMNDILWFANLTSNGAKVESAAGVETNKGSNSSITLGAAHSHKKDGSEVFYQAALTNADAKTGLAGAETKTTTLMLPITVGVEVDAASWLTVRGSVSQSTFIVNSKTDTAGVATAETAPGANTTTVAIGAGLKFNKLTLDGSLLQTGAFAGNGGQSVDATNLLAQVGATYWF